MRPPVGFFRTWPVTYLSIPPPVVHRLHPARAPVECASGTVAGMGSAGIAVMGAMAGAGGAMLLRWVPRGVRVSVPVCAVSVAALWALTAGQAGPGIPLWWWPVPALLGWIGVLLAGADLLARRLPDALTVPAYPLVAAALGFAAVSASCIDLLPRAAVGGLLWAGGYAAVRLVSPRALGGGDVKLAGSLGALTAATSWSGLMLAIFAAGMLTAMVAVPARILGYPDVPHGPAMLVAAWLVVLHPPV